MRKTYIYSVMATLLLAVVAFFFFYPDDVEGRVLQQHDIQQGLANGHEIQEYKEATGIESRWTDSLFGGMPTFQIAPSYSANKLLNWVTALYTLGLPSPANLLFGMMFGFFIMLLCMKFRWHTALLGAVGWGLSSYFVIIIGAGHIWKFLTLMYIPPTLGGIALCYRRKWLPGFALASLFGAMQLMSNHVQMTYYFFFVIIALMAGWLIEAVKRKEVKQWCLSTLVVVGAGILALGANSASLYNTYQYSKETIRGKATELSSEASKSSAEASLDYNTQWSYGIGETFSLLIPDVNGGASLKPDPEGSGLVSVAQSDYINSRFESGEVSPEEYQFYSQFPQYFGSQPMTNGPVYVGAFMLLLAVMAFFVVKGPLKWCLLAVSVLAVFLSWGHNFMWLTRIFHDFIPGYSKFRTPASILVIVEFTVPLLAAMCIREIIRDREFFSRYSRQFYCVFGLGALICILGWISPGIFNGGSALTSAEADFFNSNGLSTDPLYRGVIANISAARLDLVRADCLRSLIFILLGAAVIFVYVKGMLKSRIIMVCSLSVLAVIDLFAVDRRYIDSDNFTDPAEPVEQFDMTAADRQILADKSHYRVLDADDFGGARSSYFHKTVGGYHAAKLTRYSDLIERQISHGNEAVLDMLNTKYVISKGTVLQRPTALGPAWIVSEVKVAQTPDEEMSALDNLNPLTMAMTSPQFASSLQGASKTPGDTIRLLSYAPDKLIYESKTAKPAVAVFSEIYFPWGWHASIDGKPADIARVNYTLRALRLPAGTHRVEMTFNPTSLNTTNTIGIVCVVLIYVSVAAAILLWILFAMRNRKGRKEE